MLHPPAMGSRWLAVARCNKLQRQSCQSQLGQAGHCNYFGQCLAEPATKPSLLHTDQVLLPVVQSHFHFEVVTSVSCVPFMPCRIKGQTNGQPFGIFGSNESKAKALEDEGSHPLATCVLHRLMLELQGHKGCLESWSKFYHARKHAFATEVKPSLC